ncbi:MAG: hypothetical protein WD066_15205 [Planctomycetaceae bacterium]
MPLIVPQCTNDTDNSSGIDFVELLTLKMSHAESQENHSRSFGRGSLHASASCSTGRDTSQQAATLDRERGGPPLVQVSLPREDLLTFADLMELHFIRIFRAQGVSLQIIRKAAAAAAAKFEVDHPFAVHRFDTDGRTIFATLQAKETDKEVVEDLRHGQYVFQKFVKPFYRKFDYAGMNAVERFWPMEHSGRIVLDPMRRFGQPIDAETGVSTESIMQVVETNDDQESTTIAEWLGIPVEAVQAAISFERSLVS